MAQNRAARLVVSSGAAVLAATLVALALRAGGLRDPIEFDPVVYLTIGSNSLDGLLPYRDLFDHKGPLTYWLYAGIDLVALGAPVGVRLVLLASFAVSIALLASLVRRRADLPATWAVTLIYGLAGSSEAFVAEDPNLEQMLLPVMVGAIWAADRFAQERRLVWACASGVAIGVLVACKPTFGLLAVVCLGLVLYRPPRRAAAVTAMALGGVAVVALSIAPFAFAGALDDLRFGLITFNERYTGPALDQLTAHGAGALLDFAWWSPSVGFVVFGVAALAFAWTYAPRYRPLLAIAGPWALVMYLDAKIQVRDFPYYFVPLTPPLSIMIGAGLAAVADRGVKRGRVAAIAAMLAAPLAVHYGLQDRADRSISMAARLPADLASPLHPGGLAIDDLAAGPAAGPPDVPDDAVAEVLRRVTAPGDRVYVAGEYAGGAYWLADRRPASRILCTTCHRPQPPYAEIAAELRRSPPAAIVVVDRYRTDYLRAALKDMRPLPRDPRAGYRVYVRP